ncbi:BMP family ABC transporter substrate-binding protein [Nocardioides sp. L-11A]|uniref:BMP family ABC transporter substrate-binding protein n=1 Tax=Nocardioides sp. L-11A TaxID=3043848 RepID=UPI00249B4CF1|nr:BMP family ABC transporter substrate-binding protein [Nocardioides sp. L-11A]
MSTTKKIRVGWIHRATHAESSNGWLRGHELGRAALEAALGDRVDTEVVVGAGRGEGFVAAARDFGERGFDLVFACDSRGGLEVLPVAAEYPATRYMHNQGVDLAPNFGTFRDARDEHAYVSGLLCGGMSRSGQLGCIGGAPGPTDLQIANAWALGVRAANPDAVIHDRWVGSYFADDQVERERAAVLDLVDLGVDTFGGTLVEMPTITALASELGLWSMGRDPRSIDQPSVLDVAYVDWAPFYIAEAQAVLDGRWRARHVYLRARDGVVRNSPPSSVVPAEVAARALDAAERLRAGTLDIWRGPIKDHTGRVRVPAGQTLADVYDGPAPEPDLPADAAYLTSVQAAWLVEGFVGTVDPEQEWLAVAAETRAL